MAKRQLGGVGGVGGQSGRAGRATQFGEDHPESRVGKQSPEDDPRLALAMQLEKVASALSKSPEALLSELLEQHAGSKNASQNSVGEMSTTQANLRSSSSRVSVIRNRTQVIRTSAAIITALQEALDYNPKIHHNQTPPEIWRDNPEYIAALQRIANELKALNDLLRKPTSAQKEHNSVVNLGVHINEFLKGFSSVAGKGAGCLLIASLGGLLYQTGLVPDLAESALKHIKLAK